MNDKVKLKEGYADRNQYIKAKLRALREFGYSTLTEDVVRDQLALAEAGKTMEEGLDVIGMFISDDLSKVKA